MRSLTKIKLINWHYFTNETIPLEGSALITGDNGAGKSTLIDALQVVIIANLKKIKFNSSAFDEKTTRDLKSYLRGKTGAEGNTYLRGERDFSSYVVLEITHTPTQKPYLIGVVFDYFSSSGEEEHVFFRVDEHPLEDSLFFQDGVPRNRQQFFHHLKVKKLKFRQYRNDIEGYLSDLRQLFGGVKESFFSLFGKGISFSPITNLRSFVYEYILEERRIDVDTMRDYFEKFRQVENLILETEQEIKALELISQEYGEIENLRRQEQISQYMEYRARWEQKKLELVQAQERQQQIRERLVDLRREMELLENRRRQLVSEKEEIETKIADHQVARRERELSERKQRLQQQIQQLEKIRTNLFHQVRVEIAERERLLEVLRRVDAPFELTEALLGGREDWQRFLDDGTSFPVDLEEQSRNWNECMTWLTRQEARWEEEKKRWEEKEAELKQTIEELQKNQVLSSASPAMKLKKLLQEHMIPNDGRESIPVYVFCEAIDIRDRRWQNAIEGYLHTQKFDLLVPPGYFDQALDIYERYKFTHGIENVGLVNTEKLLLEAKPARKGSLAEEIVADEDYVLAYANWLLGAVMKCETEKELKRHRRAITPTCMLYQNHTARQIPKSRYEVPYIGREAVKVQLARKQKEWEECRRKLSLLKERLEAVASVSNLESSKADRYQRWLEEFTACRELDELGRELYEVNQELLSLDRSELDRLEEEKKEKEAAIEECRVKRSGLDKEEGQLETELDFLAQKLKRLSLEEKECRGRYLSFAESLSDDLLGTCRQKWERESRKKVPSELERNYGSHIQRLRTRINNGMLRLVELRKDFNNRFNFAGDPRAEDNRAYEERHRLLVESHLQEYREEARKAREKAEQAFKEHFVARLRESIELAREEIKELNRALKDLKFGKDSYSFRLSPRPGMREYYDMIMDPNLHMGETLFSQAFRDRHGDTLDRLFREITVKDEDFQERMQQLTDYRSYLDFEIVITDEQGNKSYFSRVSRDKSGGETQVPFYVAILASFYQAYHLYRKKDTLRLVVFDEAFNRMDADNVEECVRFIRKLGFQALIVAPTGKIQLIVPHVNTNIIVMREGYHSFVERVTRKDIENWAQKQ
ncbi:ATP-binding protein [Calderihabitans maritimus]|uniref:Uncharacterized protein n=1 Tax=Calderihabitans maritimus TaxID=1246530 RepID=A0A1Z5HUI9_9FIRM|nr:SbcC/MukB-like Walker B domain-containing protein [Calderihabitans maritimus]GAW93203.1 hypothetical protein Desgi_3814 [Calderihabitans maritimus]